MGHLSIIALSLPRVTADFTSALDPLRVHLLYKCSVQGS